MNRTFFCLLSLLLSISISHAAGDLWSEGPDLSKVKPGFYGGDGTSQKRAVIAVGLDYSAPRWIAQKYPASSIQDVSLVIPPGKKR